MAKIEIGGQEIQVSDAYNDLSDDQKKKFKRRLARDMGISLKPKKKEAESTGIDDILRFGLGQGLALGFGDEIEAGARSLFEDRSYSEIRDDIRGQLDSYREDNPGKALAMELGGGLLTGGAGLAGAGIGAGVKSAIKQGAKVGSRHRCGRWFRHRGRRCRKPADECRYWGWCWRCTWCGVAGSGYWCKEVHRRSSHAVYRKHDDQKADR